MKKYKLEIEIQKTTTYVVEIATKKELKEVEELYSDDMLIIDSCEDIEGIVNYNNDTLVSIEDLDDYYESELLNIYELEGRRVGF